jgi:DNA-binding HxlR family transcriptional regulator
MSPDHRITGSPDHRILTALQSLILSELQQRGPMRDVELWQHSKERNLLTVTLACLELESEGYIEIPRGVRPVSFEWQLTQKGKEQAAALSGGARV